jgi:hypothetical protein
MVAASRTVMPGLDPGIHLVFEEWMDCRVKPGNDGYVLQRGQSKFDADRMRPRR